MQVKTTEAQGRVMFVLCANTDEERVLIGQFIRQCMAEGQEISIGSFGGMLDGRPGYDSFNIVAHRKYTLPQRIGASWRRFTSAACRLVFG